MKLITVTQQHIDEGITQDCQECPVALAIATQFPPGTRVTVAHLSAVIRLKEKDAYSLRLPESAIQFIRDFDYERPVSPFTFYLPDHKEDSNG